MAARFVSLQPPISQARGRERQPYASSASQPLSSQIQYHYFFEIAFGTVTQHSFATDYSIHICNILSSWRPGTGTCPAQYEATDDARGPTLSHLESGEGAEA